ncbi:hypothetical protein ACWDG9_33375 [Streptomyces sp. NPDC001073]
MTVTSGDPFGAYTDEAEYFDELPNGDLEDYLRPFEAGLLMAAGRMLAVCVYHDAASYADRPFDRNSKDAAATVLHLLPEACDGQDAVFRRGVARAFWDLADSSLRPLQLQLDQYDATYVSSNVFGYVSG